METPGSICSIKGRFKVFLIRWRNSALFVLTIACASFKLTGIDDYFLRVVNPSILLTDLEASYVFKDASLRRVATIYDLSNRAYSEEFAVNFKLAFERLGGEIVSTDTGPFEIDSFGDARRSAYVTTIFHNRFKIVIP